MLKKKQFKSFICMFITFLMVFTSVDTGILGMKQVFAETTEAVFEFDASTGTIIGYKGDNVPNDLVLPDKINGVDVYHIGNNAFVGAYIQSVKLPKNLKTIGLRAFFGNNIKELKLPESVVTIRGGAFKRNGLKTVVLNDNIKEIKAAAFEENKLEHIDIPRGLEKIEDDVFKKNNIKKLVIPNTVTEIGNGSFAFNPIENITFSNLITKIGNSAFHDSNIETLELPDSLVEIGMYAFRGGKIKTINIPKSVKQIGREAFSTTKHKEYVRLFTEDPTNPENFTDGISTIVNPAKVTVKYQNDKNNSIKEAITLLGKDNNNEVITDYNIKNSMDSYYRIGQEYKFEAKEIENYEKLDNKTFKLEQKDNVVTFTYKTKAIEENSIIEEIKPYIQNLKGYNYNYLVALSMKHLGEEQDLIKSKMYIRDNYSQACELAGNIITLFAAGEDPRNYKGKDYVNELVEAQRKNGNFKLGYTEPDEKDLMMSIIALDIVGAKYNEEVAVNLLIRKAKKDGTKYFYEYKGTEGDRVQRTALALIALSKHQKNPEVSRIVAGAKNYFKSRQYKDGNIEGFSYNGRDPQFRTSTTASVIQALIAIGEDPLDSKWIKNNKTLVDGLMSFKLDGKFVDKQGSSIADKNSTINAFAALSDLSMNSSMYGKGEKGEEPIIDTTKPYSIKIKFANGKAIEELEVGSKVKLVADVLNEDGQVLEKEASWLISNEDALQFVEPNTFLAKEVKEETKVTITAKLEENELISKSIELVIKPKIKIDEPIIKADLDEEIEFLKSCYEAYVEEDGNGDTGSEKIALFGTGAAKLSGMDMDKIRKNIYIDSNNNLAFFVSRSIITLIGADLDPRQYKDEKGDVRNLVEELVRSQVKEGENKGEFFIGKSDTNSIEALMMSIIALDMARAEYNKDLAVKRLIEMYNKKDSHTYKELNTEGLLLTALSKHKDVLEAKSLVNEILEYLHKEQNEFGGFDIKSGANKGKNSPVATGRVIQGLIANGINPLEDKDWIKNGSTMLDAIVKSKTVKDNMKHSGYGRGEEDEYTYYVATYTAFGALVDLKNQKSMFEILDIIDEPVVEPEQPEQFVAKRIGKGKLKKDSSAKVKFNIENKSGKDEEVTLAIVLYDENTNKMINYSYVEKTLKSGEEESFAGGFILPERGSYVVKSIICNSLDKEKNKMNILLDPVKIAVE